jgi:hypothetical protein
MKQFRDTPYYITEDGNIFNLNKQLFVSLTNKGYKTFRGCINGIRKHITIHRAVAECYIPNPDNLPQVNHIDGNKLNNHVSNLEWTTNQKNRDHAVQNGLHARGEQIGTSRFTEEDIKWIRQNYIPNHHQFGMSAMARKLNTYPSTIHKIIHRTRWKHI